MNKYKCLNSTKWTRGDYSLTPIREKDIFKIKKWRNAQLDVLRQKELLTNNDQRKYYNTVIKNSFLEKKPDLILFSYLHKNECIGYGGFVHISWKNKEAEISFIVNSERAKVEKVYKNDFLIYLKLIKIIAFQDIGFKKIFTETYSFRRRHAILLEKSGFILRKIHKNNISVKGKIFNSLIHSINNIKI